MVGAVQARELARECRVEVADGREARRWRGLVGAHQPRIVVQSRVTRIAEHAQGGRVVRDQLLIVGVARQQVLAKRARLARSAHAAAMPGRDCASSARTAAHAARRRAARPALRRSQSRSSNNTPMEVRNAAEFGATRRPSRSSSSARSARPALRSNPAATSRSCISRGKLVDRLLEPLREVSAPDRARSAAARDVRAAPACAGQRTRPCSSRACASSSRPANCSAQRQLD